MAYSHECPFCGANLDPGERCDCKREDRRKRSVKVFPRTLKRIYRENK